MPAYSYRMLLNMFECYAHLPTYIIMGGPCLVWKLEMGVEDDLRAVPPLSALERL